VRSCAIESNKSSTFAVKSAFHAFSMDFRKHKSVDLGTFCVNLSSCGVIGSEIRVVSQSDLHGGCCIELIGNLEAANDD
jgi:hypothetical protein